MAARSSPKVTQLNQERLGRLLLNVAPVSAMLGHKHPKSSLGDYVHPGDDLEREFIIDLFTLTTEEIADKWYGGLAEASAFVVAGGK